MFGDFFFVRLKINGNSEYRTTGKSLYKSSVWRRKQTHGIQGLQLFTTATNNSHLFGKYDSARSFWLSTYHEKQLFYNTVFSQCVIGRGYVFKRSHFGDFSNFLACFFFHFDKFNGIDKRRRAICNRIIFFSFFIRLFCFLFFLFQFLHPLFVIKLLIYFD